MTTTTQQEPLSLIRWYRGHAWAKKRAVRNATFRRVPVLLIFHPEHGYGAVSERMLPRYDTTDITVVERIDES